MNILSTTDDLIFNMRINKGEYPSITPYRTIDPDYTEDELKSLKPMSHLFFPMNILPSEYIEDNPIGTFIPILELFKDNYYRSECYSLFHLHHVNMIQFFNPIISTEIPWLPDWVTEVTGTPERYAVMWNTEQKCFYNINFKHLNKDTGIHRVNSLDIWNGLTPYEQKDFLTINELSEIYKKLIHWNFDILDLKNRYTIL